MINIMNNKVCSDNCFDTIEQVKKSIIKNTNIEYNSDKTKVLDNKVFRCGLGLLARLNLQHTIPEYDSK